MSHRRVVITGMGVVTPCGNDLGTFWNNIVNGVSGIGPITHFDVSVYDCQIAGEVRDFEPAKVFKSNCASAFTSTEYCLPRCPSLATTTASRTLPVGVIEKRTRTQPSMSFAAARGG